MTWVEWYDSLPKPSWTPAPATIGLIRQIMHPVIPVGLGSPGSPPSLTSMAPTEAMIRW